MAKLHKICFIIAFVSVFSVLLGQQYAFAIITPLINENFDSYNLGTINGQNGWATAGAPTQVVNTQSQTAPQSIYGVGVDCSKTFSGWNAEDYISFYFYMATGTNAKQMFLFDDAGSAHNLILLRVYCAGSGDCSLQHDQNNDGSWTDIKTAIPRNTWHNLIVHYSKTTSTFNVKYDTDAYTTDNFPFFNNNLIAKIHLLNNYSYVDTITSSVPPAYITISSPTSGTEITATSDTLSVNYYGVDPDLYNGILLNFRDDKLHASTNSYNYELATSDTGTGNFNVSLSEFGFDTNGHWDLHASAYGYSLQIQDGLFLTTRGYIDTLTGELVNPPFHLIFNVSGLAEPFVFDDWDTWYGTNVSDYASPTTFATTITGYLQPYFEKVGGFGAQASLYFNEAEAYDRGYGLGEIIPIILQYNSKIDMFFGGFPIFTFFRYLLYTMIAMFIVRTILKFIPFIG
jgi:hypothetical protein